MSEASIKHIDAIIFDAYGYYVKGGGIGNESILKSEYEKGGEEYKKIFWDCANRMETDPIRAGYQDSRPAPGFVKKLESVVNDYSR